MRRAAWAALWAAPLAIAAACAGPQATTVEVTLVEFGVVPDLSEVRAGSVTFEATNDGPNDPHELVVIRTDLAADALPTDEDGAVDEDGEGIEVMGEIEEFPVGETLSMTLELEAGSYVLICNLVELEDGEIEAHYALGMRTPFTVTGD